MKHLIMAHTVIPSVLCQSKGRIPLMYKTILRGSRLGPARRKQVHRNYSSCLQSHAERPSISGASSVSTGAVWVAAFLASAVWGLGVSPRDPRDPAPAPLDRTDGR